ncbi:MAG: hypothetical protein LBM23_10785 [Propionibacteriaceae bacterium]|jgi:hypothetical protein|nr:hypothetical protein [Propionibacteriaceae bacterium]
MTETPNRPVRVNLTFAELEFLFGQNPRWPAVREALNGEIPDSPQVVAAGAASLLARGLARFTRDEQTIIDGTVATLANRLVEAEAPLGITMISEGGMAPAVYCVGADGGRTLVSIEAPGVAGFQPLPEDLSPVDQAMTLFDRAISVEGAVTSVKVAGQLPVLIRKRDGGWELGDSDRDPADLDSFFRATTEGEARRIVREYIIRNLGQQS